MGTIIAKIEVTQTVANANGAAVQAVQDWILTNVINKLPATASGVVTYQVLP
jgi:hypothetical protein